MTIHRHHSRPRSPLCPGLPRLVLVAAAALAAACGASSGPPPTLRYSETWSFEGGLEGWQPRALDLEYGPGLLIPWSLAPSTARASDGATSLEVWLDNRSDAGKIFVERAIDLEPDTEYDVVLRFDLGTADWGDVNDFHVLAGALPSSPASGNELIALDAGSTASRGDEGVYVWRPKRIQRHVRTGPSGQLFVVVGIWGAYEVARTYYLDDLDVEVLEPG